MLPRRRHGSDLSNEWSSRCPCDSYGLLSTHSIDWIESPVGYTSVCIKIPGAPLGVWAAVSRSWQVNSDRPTLIGQMSGSVRPRDFHATAMPLSFELHFSVLHISHCPFPNGRRRAFSIRLSLRHSLPRQNELEGRISCLPSVVHLGGHLQMECSNFFHPLTSDSWTECTRSPRRPQNLTQNLPAHVPHLW